MLEADATSYTHRKRLGDLILTQNEALRIECRIDSSCSQQDAGCRGNFILAIHKEARDVRETEAASY